MDDLDHSMYIAENEWTCFYEESEECGLLQPPLAPHDIPSLKHSSNTETSSSVFVSGQQEPQQSNEDESLEVGCCIEEDDCTGCVKHVSGKIIQSDQQEGQDDSATKTEMCLDLPEATTMHTEEQLTEKTNDHDITATQQTEQLNVQPSAGESTELKQEDGDAQMKSDIHGFKSSQDPDPLSCNPTELNESELRTSDRAVSKDVSGVALRAEKERWFVTVNESPARQRGHAPSVKKKRRTKKTCNVNHMCKPELERSTEKGLKMDEIKDDRESEGEMNSTQTNQNLVKDSESCLCVGEELESLQMGLISDSSPITLPSVEEDSLSGQLVLSHSSNDNIIEPPINKNLGPAKEPSRSDSVESDQFEDSAEFFSTHSFDSESYLSASESLEELQHLISEHQQWQSSSSLVENSCLFNLTEDTYADNAQDRELHSSDSTLLCNVTAPYSEDPERTDDLIPLSFTNADQSYKMLNDNSKPNNNEHSKLPLDSDELQQHEVNLPASVCTSGDQLPPIPDLSITPCPVADSPETYAEAAGDTRPVYAISAFWDEMEKLTINDILQLRKGRSSPSKETPESLTPNADDHSSLVDTVEYNSSDGGHSGTSDTADSDYFTQPDESKPDRSSCEFSTSDFEEEYWQFLDTSRNPSPDPYSKKQSSTSESPPRADEEEESTGSEGKETPVPSEDFERKCLEGQANSDFISIELAWPRRITKSKSVHNVQALNTENRLNKSTPLLLGNDESSLFLSSCLSLEENMVLEASDSLRTVIPFPDEHNLLSFPEMFQCSFKEETTKGDSQCVIVYDPEDISVAPMFDFTLLTFRNEMPFFSLSDSQFSKENRIPIFSCSPPTVRDLTFPNQAYIFLSADCRDDNDISPFRVVSHSFLQGRYCGARAPHELTYWSSLIRKMCPPDKGSLWPRRSGSWVFPYEAEQITMRNADPPITALTKRRVSSTPSQLFREMAVQQTVLEAIQTTRQEGIFSALRQSDMCLVCIAFASWVLKSSDPDADDAWKAALLANVSALSAIQYLRRYVKRKNNPS